MTKYMRPMLTCRLLAAGWSAWGLIPAGGVSGELPATAEQLFRTESVWDMHLSFTPEQWAAIEPENLVFPGPGRDPGMGSFPAQTIIKQGDQDHSGGLSRAELGSLVEEWFAQWDRNKAGILDRQALQAGLESTLAPPMPGPPGAGNQADKRPGGPMKKMEYPYVHGNLEFGGHRLDDVGVRYKGNNSYMVSRGQLKRPFKIDLNKYVKGQNPAEVTALNLHNSVNDPGWMNEALSYRLYRDAGVPSSRTAYARLCVTKSGGPERQYFGLYTMVENVDKNYLNERFGTKKGALFKPSTRDLFSYAGDSWALYKESYSPKTELSEDDARRLIDFAKLVSQSDDAEFAAKLGEYLDLDQFARYMAVTVWLSTMDSILGMGHNFYVYLNPKNNRFQFLPWDFDHSFGHFPMAGATENLSIRKPWRNKNRFLERVFSVEAFNKLYLKYMEEFSGTIFQPERLDRQVDELAAAIAPAVRAESEEKLAKFLQLAAGESAENAEPGGGPGPRAFGPPGGARAYHSIKQFVRARFQSVNDQLAGKLPPEPEDGAGRGPGGFGPPRFGPRLIDAGAWISFCDTGDDGSLTLGEWKQGFASAFQAWDLDRSDSLNEEEVREGLKKISVAPPVELLQEDED